jgi:hypothetical protein
MTGLRTGYSKILHTGIPSTVTNLKELEKTTKAERSLYLLLPFFLERGHKS